MSSLKRIDALMRPGSVAVIGASERAGSVGQRALGNLIGGGFTGPVIPVNPNADEIMGLPCVASVLDASHTVDLALLAIPANQVIPVLDECAEAGVAGAIVFASGFAEVGPERGGTALQVPASVQEKVAVIGPNSLGVICATSRLYASFSSVAENGQLAPGSVGFATQSGALGIYLYRAMSHEGLGCSAWFSTGNEDCLTTGELLSWMALDEGTEIAYIYSEGVRNSSSLVTGLADMQEAGKPVIALRGGRTADGASATASHTGFVAGDSVVFSGLLQQYGAIEVADPQQMIHVTKLLRQRRERRGGGIAVASTSGGGAALVSDLAQDFSVPLAGISDGVRSRLTERLPDFATVRNPLDVTGSYVLDGGLLADCLAELESESEVGWLVALYGASGPLGDEINDSLVELSRRVESPLVAIWLGSTRDECNGLTARGVPAFSEVGPCLDAIARIERLQRSLPVRGALVHATDRGRGTLLGADDPSSSRGTVLDEAEGKAILQRAGIEIPRFVLLPPDDGESALEGVTWSLSVVKGVSDAIAHKARLGLVELSVGRAELPDAISRVRAAARNAGLRLKGVLVEEMLGSGVDLLVSIRRDHSLGPSFIIAPGGDHAEEFKLATARVYPFDPEELRTRLCEIPLVRLAVGDQETFARMCAKMVEVWHLLPDRCGEFEINPLRWINGEYRALDFVAFCDG
jgi:acetate---CoA ligase (ADP-forming)